MLTLETRHLRKHYLSHAVPAKASTVARRPVMPAASQGDALLHWQRKIGNQAVQRNLSKLPGVTPPATLQRNTPIAPTISTTNKPGLLQRGWGDEKLDARIEPKAVGEAKADCGVAKRKVTKLHKERGATDPFGSTESKLIVEYTVDESDHVTLGCLRPEFTITIFTPFITSDEFIEKFTPLMQKLWDKYKGNIQTFSEDRDVRNFNYYDQTMRHEEMHVGARMLAIYDLLPRYKRFLKDTDGLKKGEAHFLDMTDRFWASGWDEQAEIVTPHERIHYLDARLMVEEYQHRAGTERPKRTATEKLWDIAKSFLFPE